MVQVPADIFPPGSTIGILGGGQLGRMTALAAAKLGYRCRILDPDPACPAGHVAPLEVASFTDQAALARFAEQVDVITLEFENLPAESLRFLAAIRPVHPNADCLATAQDRILEKSFFNRINVPTAPWQEIHGPADIAQAAKAIGLPLVIKTARDGYDGKGQTILRSADEAAITAAWAAIGQKRAIAEGFVSFSTEISVIAARNATGEIRVYDTTENRHQDHILHTSIVPAHINDALRDKAEAIARHVADNLQIIGLIAVEMFVTHEGEVIVNEMAPRPHNSGHWTMDGCHCSQFEQLVRAVCGLPLGTTSRTHDVEMTNLLGDAIHDWPAILAEAGARLHHYGKGAARPGRKMGHINRLRPLAR